MITAVPLGLDPEISGQWSGVLLVLSALYTLGPALAQRRTGWHTIVFALALRALRTEYGVRSGPYLIAARVLPRGEAPSRRAIVIAIAGWAALLVSLQLLFAVPPVRAVANLAALLAVIPLTTSILRLAGHYAWRSAYTVMWFASLSSLIAVLVLAIRKSQHIDSATVTVWFSLAVGSLSIIERDRVAPGAAACLIAIVFSTTSFTGYFKRDRYNMMLRHSHAVMKFRDQVILDSMSWTHDDVRALQDLVPPGATIAFWGQSAAHLDFRRNPIRDVSWPVTNNVRRERDFLPALLPQHLLGSQYLLLEDLENKSPKDRWSSGYAPATSEIEDHLDELAKLGIARLYRVR
jgi:hypothetical protein